MQSHPVWVCGLKLKQRLIEAKKNKSHPVWVCGLKHHLDYHNGKGEYVTPCMGVWIETQKLSMLILPQVVTPCMGVWIETCLLIPGYVHRDVTPCMGVWIETEDTVASHLQV